MNKYHTAQFSSDRKYRYALWRIWNNEKPYVLFIGLNPSTADETEDDPTIRRCIQFAKDWEYGGICMVNLFAFRATDPKVIKNSIDPIGSENDMWLINLSQEAGFTIAAWGTNGSYQNRDKEVMELLPHIWCLGTTKNGFPKHPLYLRKDTEYKKFGEWINE